MSAASQDFVEILLIRHGESEGNEAGRFGGHGPTPLTQKGHAQARAVAAQLTTEAPTFALYASDLPRAIQTAQPFADATGLQIRTTSALRERSVGLFTGMSFAEVEAQHPDLYTRLLKREEGFCPPDGETHATCLQRAATFLDPVVHAAEPGTRLVFFSHAVTINLLLRKFLRLEGVPYAHIHFRTDNCAIHRLRRTSDGALTVMQLNDMRHLTQL